MIGRHVQTSTPGRWEAGTRFPLPLVALALAACQPTPPAEPSAAAPQSSGQALAHSSCRSCHAVVRYGTSPNPDAPPFDAIANQQGLTAQSLSTWLRDAHNYPREMQFELGAAEIDALVAYMLTLQDPNYKPPID